MNASAARDIVLARAGGACELCGCTGETLDWAHRIARTRGGTWTPANGLRLCRSCHNVCHANPIEAHRAGLMIPSGVIDPCDWPVYLGPRDLTPGWWLLDDQEPLLIPLDRRPVPDLIWLALTVHGLEAPWTGTHWMSPRRPSSVGRLAPRVGCPR